MYKLNGNRIFLQERERSAAKNSRGINLEMEAMKEGFFACVVSCVICFSAVSACAQEKEVLGWQEKARIFPGELVIHAKLDTGADFSSLDATDIVEFKKDDKQTFVRFTITNRYGKHETLERPLRRIALIKRAEGKTQKRAVVLLGICVGTSYMEEEVNLINRSKFSNQMLIGRSFLAGKAMIDPAVTYTVEPNCQGILPPETKARKKQGEKK